MVANKRKSLWVHWLRTPGGSTWPGILSANSRSTLVVGCGLGPRGRPALPHPRQPLTLHGHRHGELKGLGYEVSWQTVSRVMPDYAMLPDHYRPCNTTWNDLFTATGTAGHL